MLVVSVGGRLFPWRTLGAFRCCGHLDHGLGGDFLLSLLLDLAENLVDESIREGVLVPSC